MKKILAIAVATAISAPAMADMTVSASAAVGYTSTDKASYTAAEQRTFDACAYNESSDADAVETCQDAVTKSNGGNGGFGVDTATVIFSGSETLENGLTVSGTFGFGGGARGETVSGKDAGLTVSGDFGKVSVMAAEIGHGVFGYGSAVAENFQGELTSPAGNADSIKYTAPAMGIATISVGYTEEVGLGKGEDSDFSPNIKAALAFSDALTGFVDYRTYDDAATEDSRIRVGAKYDAGVAVISAAVGKTSQTGNDLTNTILGVTVPMGATTLGANFGNTDAGTAATDRDAWSVGMKHELSSNVAVTAKYTKYDLNATTDVTNTSVLMSLSF